MAIPDARSVAYYEFFKNQRGGYLPVFQGTSRCQTGNGFGDIFRGVVRTVLPILLSGAKAFLGAFGDAQSQGASITDSLKASIRPTAAASLTAAQEQIVKQQKGSGRKRLYKHRKSIRNKRRKLNRNISYNF